MKNRTIARIAALLTTLSLSAIFTAGLFAADDKVVATVKGEKIMDSQIAARMATANQTRDDALNDLIEQEQMRIVAADKGIKVPAGNWNTEQRAKIDTDFVKALSLPIQSNAGDVIVDHAYFKLPEDQKAQKEGLAQMEKLRAMAAEGVPIPEGYNKLQADGTNWHIGDHEEYPATALPDETRELPAGGLSQIITGSDGYHMFKIYERKIPAEDIRQAVRIYLIENAFDWVSLAEE